MLTVLDLFSGIGGFSLGLERTGGFKTIGFCEIDPYCAAVLKKHWPNVPCHDDIRDFQCGAGYVDVLCGGFPCQDLSIAGKRAGLGETRSGLWSSFFRLIRQCRPQYAIVENTPGLLSLGMGDILRDLASVGYDAEWGIISAADVGAQHLRERVWIIAYPHDMRKLQSEGGFRNVWGRLDFGAQPTSTDFDGAKLQERFVLPGIQAQAGFNDDRGNSPADTGRLIESPLVRKLHGIPHRVDRIRALGNSIVPAIAELIGRAILKAEQERC